MSTRARPLQFIACLVAVIGFGAIGVSSHAVQSNRIMIGTGVEGGLYHLVGRTICREIAAPPVALSCEPRTSAGSIPNLYDVRHGTLSLGIVRADQQHDAALGMNNFAVAGPDASLRSLFSWHVEPFTLLVRPDAGIASLEDLPGHRINIGSTGSAQSAGMTLLMDASGWTHSSFPLTTRFDEAANSFALCDGRIDAGAVLAGHPSASVEDAGHRCKARIAEVSGPAVDALLEAHPAFFPTEIPGQLYASNPEPVQTFGTRTTIVASEALDDDTVYEIVARVFEGLDAIRGAHPAFEALDPSSMAQEGHFAPLHPGAERYFREHGLLNG